MKLIKCVSILFLFQFFFMMICPEAIAQEKHLIKGVVKDVNGETIVGATIVVKGTTRGTTTGINGDYHIRVSKGETLVFSFIGMKNRQVVIEQQTRVNVTLKDEAVGLKEVVVVGYGTQRKVNLTGAVAAVKSDELESRPVASLSQALQGIVPGLSFTENAGGGELGNNMTPTIRGIGTIGDGSEGAPLILIDGVEGDMNSLNPNDIENISVLKDAASAAVYGSRAPFGVVLITTKQGKKGAMKVNYSNNFRWSSPVKVPKTLDSYTYALYMNESSFNDNAPAIYTQEMIDRILAYQSGEITEGCLADGDGKYGANQKGNANNNWYDIHFKDWAFSHDHSMSFSGGSDKMSYFVSGNYLDQSGLLEYGEDELSRYSFNTKLNSTLKKWLSFNVNVRYMGETLDKPTFGEAILYHDILRMAPTTPLINPDGRYSESSRVIHLQDGGRTIQQKHNINNQIQLVLSPVKNWKIYAKLNMKADFRNYGQHINAIYSYDKQGNAYGLKFKDQYQPGLNSLRELSERKLYLSPDLYTDYGFKHKGHEAKIMLGFSAEQSSIKSQVVEKNGLIGENPNMNNALGSITDITAVHREWATLGFFGRLNYNYRNRYLLEANLRYDGSSRFPQADRWAYFPSFSLGWNIAREGFWKDVAHIINEFKPRASWGRLGNQNTTNFYPYYERMPIEALEGEWLFGNGRPTVASSPSLISSSLTWEKIESTNFGFDLGMLRNRLNLSVDGFIRHTKDMVGPAKQMSPVLGTAVPKINNAELKTSGWELSVGWRDRIQSFGYYVNFNVSDSRTVVTKYPNINNILPSPDKANIYYEGMELGEVWGYHTHGIAQSQSEMDLWNLHSNQSILGSNWREGDIMYYDLNRDGEVSSGAGTLADPGDLSIIANTTPRYNFGARLGADWKGVDCSVLLQGVGKRDVYVSGPFFWGADGGRWGTAAFEEHLDFYRPEGHVMGENKDAYYPNPYLSKGVKNKAPQTRYIQNGAYLRVKNVQLGYSFPQTLLKKIGVTKCRMYVSADNVYTLTKLKIYDPESTASSEWGSGKLYPLQMTVSTGLNLTF